MADVPIRRPLTSGRGLKLEGCVDSSGTNQSPAHERAWIETLLLVLQSRIVRSPAHERAWIETFSGEIYGGEFYVARSRAGVD